MATIITKDYNLRSGKSILTTRLERLQQQIRNIVLTVCAIPSKGIYGEVYGLPEYGCEASMKLWEHITNSDSNDVKRAIYNGCKKIRTIEVFYNDITVAVDDIAQRAEITLYARDLTTNDKIKLII